MSVRRTSIFAFCGLLNGVVPLPYARPICETRRQNRLHSVTKDPPMPPTITTKNAHLLNDIANARFGWIGALAWSPDGRKIAVGGGDGLVMWVDTFGGKPTHRPKLERHAHVGPVNDMTFSMDGEWLGSTSADPIAILHRVNPQSGQAPGIVFKDRTDVAYTAIALRHDQQTVAIGHSDGAVRVFNQTPTQNPDRPVQALQFQNHIGEVTALAFRMGRLYSSGRDGRLISVDPTDIGAPVRVLAQHDDWVRDFAITPDGRTAFTVCKDGHLSLWDTVQPRLIHRVMAHTGGADTIAYSRVGGLLATGGRDNHLRLWDVRALLDGADAPLFDAEPHTKPVLALAFNPTGSLLLSGGGDNVIKMWAAEMITPF